MNEILLSKHDIPAPFSPRKAVRLRECPKAIASIQKAGGERARKIGVHPEGNRKQRRGYFAVAAKL